MVLDIDRYRGLALGATKPLRVADVVDFAVLSSQESLFDEMWIGSAQEHKYCDSLDPDKEFSEISYQEMRSPEPGEDGWPRMQVIGKNPDLNRNTSTYRTLHSSSLQA